MLDFYRPQLATLSSKVPEGDEWIHEIKWDGYRFVARIDYDKINLLTRNGLDWSDKFPSIVKELKTLEIEDTILDGEIVVLDDYGISSFQLLQDVIQNDVTTKDVKGLFKQTGLIFKKSKKTSSHSQKNDIGNNSNIRYYIFDILFHEGKDLRDEPLLERKKILHSLFKHWKAKYHSHIFLTEYIKNNGNEVFKAACEHNLEGIVSKKIESNYESKRIKTWLKIKCSNRQEFVIGGFTKPKGSRDFFGALLIGYFDANGDFIYAGKVGTGFDHQTLKNLYKLMLPLKKTDSQFLNIRELIPNWELKHVQFIKPKLVCEIEFTEWTKDSILRHPAFIGLRLDKRAKEVKREDKPNVAVNAKKASHKSTNKSNHKFTDKSNHKFTDKSHHKSISAKKDIQLTDKKSTTMINPKNYLPPISMTHADNKLALIGITKRELAYYYERVCENMLPYVKNRPLLMLRCPSSGTKDCFYQKHHKKAFPKDIIEPVKVPGDDNPYCLIKNLKSIIELVQFNTLEIHVWNSSTEDLEKPDRIIFDLDPGPGVSWQTIKKAANIVNDELHEFGLKSFVKLSGKKGLHVIIPFKPNYHYAEVKDCSRAIAIFLSEKYPDLFTSTVSKSQRKNKIFIDYLRNGEGSTTVAAFSIRAVDKAPISLPISWKELNKIRSAQQYTVSDLLKEVARSSKVNGKTKKDELDKLLKNSAEAWKGFYKTKQILRKSLLKKLNVLIRD